MVAPGAVQSVAGAAPAQGAATGLAALAAGAVAGVRGPILAALERTLLQPLELPPAVVGAWAVTRDIALALLTAALLYGVLQAQLARAVGLDPPAPWALVPRLLLSALGVAASLSLVRGLLAANAALTAAIVGALPGGASQMEAALTAGVGAAAGLLDIGADVGALVLLAGVAALACFYVVRAAEIVLLALLLPLAAALWVVPASAGLWRALLGELVVAIFVQSAQAAVLLVFAAGLAPAAPSPAAWLWGIAALTLLFRVRGLLERAVAGLGQWAARAPGLSAALAAIRAAADAGERLLGALAPTRPPW